MFTYILLFLLKFRLRDLFGCKIKIRIQQVPTQHTFDGSCYPKNKKYLKKCDDDIIITLFSGISYFWGSGVRQKYVVWVLVGCGIKFRTPKMRNTWKMWWWCHHHVFLSIYCFSGSEVRQKYAEWVLVDSASNELSRLKFE